jgi:hypothetical protein
VGRQTESGSGLPQGFDPPSSNVTWCPNQFFDVVLPHFSRGVVRLVGYLLWQTLAWNDEQGQPRRTRHRVNWKTLGTRAQVSRGALSEAIRAALAAHLLRPEGSDSAGSLGRVLPEALELCWKEGPYTRSPADFRGFFMGRGHRTYVPNQFFTVVIAREVLAVSRVVGAIARQSIGFEAECGHRRTDVALSCKALARLTNLSITRVHFAVGVALERGYIMQVEPGAIGRGDAQPALAARYALRWRDGGCGGIEAPQRQATKVAGPARSSKSDMAPVQKVAWPEFKKANGIEEEIKPLNETLAKPARAQVPAGALPAPGRRPAGRAEAGDRAALETRLREVGFTGRSIAALAAFPRERIERQIAWLEDRTATRSSLGLLRRAIEEDWPPPRTARRQPAPAGVTPPSPSSLPTEPSAAQRRAYGAWMRGQLVSLERSEPARYRAFLEHRDRLKASLRYVHQDRPDHGILRGWDSEAALIAHLEAFDRSLPDLETWCRRQSPARGQCPAPSETSAAMKNSQIAT